jgi:hypothetical protein
LIRADSDWKSWAVVTATLTTAMLCVGLILVGSVQAQTEVVATVPPAEYSFGQHITFHLNATAPVTITEVNLFFRIQGQNGSTAIPVDVEPGLQVDISNAYSLVDHYVPPFATITYWWVIQLDSGVQWQSEPQFLYYADNRYEWQRLYEQREGVSWEVYWVAGDVVFAQQALNVAVESLADIYPELRAPVPGVIRIFVYPEEEDLRSALYLAGYDWAGGQARPELGAILVGIPDAASAVAYMDRLIPHELTHLLVYEASGRQVGQVPPWLNEGLATSNEREPDPARRALLEERLENDRLLPLEALCAPFPTEEEAARLAYAQSASLVNYIREEYGRQAIRDLVTAYSEDVSCEAGVNRVLGKSLKGLESAWIAHLSRQGEIVMALNDSAVWIAFWLLTALVALPFVGMFRSRNPWH